MNLPAELAALLQDEAYAQLCQESLNDALVKLSREKEEILSTRPPFGVLARSETRHVFQTSLRAANDNEAGLRNRVAEVTQIDLFLKAEIEKALQPYMSTVSAEFRCCHEAVQVVSRWELAVEALHEMSHALARDAHAVAAALNPIPSAAGVLPSPSSVEQARIRSLGNLRITVSALEAGLSDVAAVRKEFTALCDASADALQLPEPPEFRHVGWVDRLATLNSAHATAEAVRCETEARAFYGEGIRHLLRQAQEVREACLEAANAILAQHWRQLRVYAQTHFVKERELDEVMAELSQHRMAAEIARRTASFEAAKVASLR